MNQELKEVNKVLKYRTSGKDATNSIQNSGKSQGMLQWKNVFKLCAMQGYKLSVMKYVFQLRFDGNPV